MEKSEKEVYTGSDSYCKVGKITAKKHYEEEQSTIAADFEKFKQQLSYILL
jgi:hypothetical protein